MSTCPNCGEELEKDRDYCSHCDTDYTLDEDYRKLRHWGLRICIIIMLVLMLSSTLAFIVLI